MTIGAQFAKRAELEALRRKLDRAISGAGIVQHGTDVDTAENFIELADVPQSYAGATGSIPTVNAAEDGLEWNPYVFANASSPILTIQNATDSEVDTLWRFVAGATPVVLFTLGVDASNDDALTLCSGDTLYDMGGVVNDYKLIGYVWPVTVDEGDYYPPYVYLSSSLDVVVPNNLGYVHLQVGDTFESKITLDASTIRVAAKYSTWADCFVQLESHDVYNQIELSAGTGGSLILYDYHAGVDCHMTFDGTLCRLLAPTHIYGDFIIPVSDIDGEANDAYNIQVVSVSGPATLFDAANTTDNAVVWQQPANSLLLGAKIVLGTQFVATSMTDLDVTLGDADADGLINATMNLTSDAEGTAYSTRGALWNGTGGVTEYYTATAKDWTAYATAVGANLDTLTEGAVTFYFTYRQL